MYKILRAIVGLFFSNVFQSSIFDESKFQSKFSFGKTLPKYFWEVGVLPNHSSNSEYISLVVSLSNAIVLVFSIR